MYIVLTYDISSKRGKKVLRLCRPYLRHVQKSVFEGEISERNLRRIKETIAAQIDPAKDAVAIYWSEYPGVMKKICIGKLQEVSISIS